MFDPEMIIAGINALAGLVGEVTKGVEAGHVVLSETDTAKIHDALVKAEQATAILRPKVDAALDAASKR